MTRCAGRMTLARLLSRLPPTKGHGARHQRHPGTDQFCGRGAEEFTIEAVTNPLSGFRIRPTHSGHCIGVLGGATQDWAPLRQEGCDPEAKGQVFYFDPVPTPISTTSS
jgi:hypothetical protein